MGHHSKRVVLVLSMLLMAAPAWSMGGSKKSETPEKSDRERRLEADRLYNLGLSRRGKAWVYAKQAVEAIEKDKRAYLRSAEREYKRAIKALEKATREDKTHYPAWGSLGYAYRKTGNYKKALKAYDRSIALKADYVEALEYRAEAYLGLGRMQDAKADYVQVVKKDDRAARLFLGVALDWSSNEKADGRKKLQAEDVSAFAKWVQEEQERLGPGEVSRW